MLGELNPHRQAGVRLQKQRDRRPEASTNVVTGTCAEREGDDNKKIKTVTL
jgi:hypothetical protein